MTCRAPPVAGTPRRAAVTGPVITSNGSQSYSRSSRLRKVQPVQRHAVQYRQTPPRPSSPARVLRGSLVDLDAALLPKRPQAEQLNTRSLSRWSTTSSGVNEWAARLWPYRWRLRCPGSGRSRRSGYETAFEVAAVALLVRRRHFCNEISAPLVVAQLTSVATHSRQACGVHKLRSQLLRRRHADVVDHGRAIGGGGCSPAS